MNEILTIVEHQTINISKYRNINHKYPTLSYEDRELLFDIKYTDKKGKKRFLFSNNGRNRIKACSIVGSVSLKNGLTVEILPKFAKGNLTEVLKKQYRETLIGMIKVSNEKNFITTHSQSGKISMNEMPLINYIIELFTNSLLNTLRQGLYQTYTKEVKNRSNIKGNILVSKTIQNNFIDKSKVYCAYSKQSSNNLLMQIFKTLARLLIQDDNLSYNAKKNLHEIHFLLKEVDIINLKPQDFQKIIFNRLNDKYEELFNQASFIFNKYMPFSSKINSTPFWSILFSMDYLFEKFLAYLFRKSDINFEEQSDKKHFHNILHDMKVKARPDFIISNDKIVCVADAKWKLLQKDKTLYGLNAQNFWQLFSYMNLVNPNEQITGYFIVPKNSDEFEDEILFEALKEGNKSISILSIDFSLPFREIVDNYKFNLNNDMLSSTKNFNKLEVINDLENEFIDLSKNHQKNKKNYINGITEENFINTYPNISMIIAKISNNSFYRDKIYYIRDFAKLSTTKIRKLFKEMILDNEDSIDVDLIMNYVQQTPNTKLNKQYNRKEHSLKSWKNKK